MEENVYIYKFKLLTFKTNIMRRRISLTLIAVVLLFCGCNKEIVEEKCYACDVPFQLECSSELQGGILFEKAMDLFSNSNLLDLKSAANDNNISISSYVNTDIKALIIELASNQTNVEEFFVTYALEEDVLDDYLVIKFEELDEVTRKTEFYDSSDQLLGSIIVQDDVIVEAYSGNTKSANGFGAKWNKCIKDAIDRMSSGTTWGNIEFLACVAFGPSCAAGTAIGCAGVALK